MKLSVCETCGQLLQFEHAACRRCGAPLGFIPGALILTTLRLRDDGTAEPASRPDEVWRRCANAEAVGCNWLVPADAADPRCAACRLNRNLADMHVPGNRAKWRDARVRQAAAHLRADALRACRSPRRRTASGAASPSTSSKARAARR